MFTSRSFDHTEAFTYKGQVESGGDHLDNVILQFLTFLPLRDGYLHKAFLSREFLLFLMEVDKDIVFPDLVEKL